MAISTSSTAFTWIPRIGIIGGKKRKARTIVGQLFCVGGRGPKLKQQLLFTDQPHFHLCSKNMDYSTQATKTRTPLNYTFDAHFSPHSPDDDLSPRSSDSEPRPPTFQLIANTMLRMELTQLEMMKKREIARLEAQKRQAELEHEMTRMMLQTQVHIASMVYHTSTRKRKRNSSCVIDHSTTSTSRADLHRLSLPAFFNGSFDAVDQVSLLLFNAAVMELYF